MMIGSELESGTLIDLSLIELDDLLLDQEVHDLLKIIRCELLEFFSAQIAVSTSDCVANVPVIKDVVASFCEFTFGVTIEVIEILNELWVELDEALSLHAWVG